jgi:CRP-like cAMP-binding protein
MKTGALGKIFRPGEVIFQEGEPGDCMFVIQEGEVEIYLQRNGQELPLKLSREGDFLGEMTLFNGGVRSVNARSKEASRLLTIDRKNFLRRIQEDPTIAFRLVQMLTRQVSELEEDVSVLSRALRESMGFYTEVRKTGSLDPGVDEEKSLSALLTVPSTQTGI